MACRIYLELREGHLLSAYFDGELADGGAFQEHLESCSECRAALVELQGISRLLAVHVGSDEPEDVGSDEPEDVGPLGPEDVGPLGPEDVGSLGPDPNFAARFWARVDETLGAPAELWRWVALRLVPVSLATLAAAVLTVVLERRGVEPFSDLERAALALGSPAVGEVAADSDLVGDPLASPLALRAPRSSRSVDSGDR